MRTYVTFLVSGTLTLIAFGATMFVQGGWQSAAAAFAVLTGVGFLTRFVSLLVTGERPASPIRSASMPHEFSPTRGRAIARRAPAVERRRELAPEPLAASRPARPGPRPQGRVSSAPA
jgi:hypothetical protein